MNVIKLEEKLSRLLVWRRRAQPNEKFVLEICPGALSSATDLYCNTRGGGSPPLDSFYGPTRNSSPAFLILIGLFAVCVLRKESKKYMKNIYLLGTNNNAFVCLRYT